MNKGLRYANKTSSRCESCKVLADVLKSDTPACCAWYLTNVVCGTKSTESCPDYEPAEVTPNG